MEKTPPSSREVVMTAINAARSGLGEEFVACFAEDLDFWFPGTTPISGRRRGLAEFKEYLGQVASYLDDLAASSPNAQTPRPITWREVLELQAVFQLTGADSLAPRLSPENWLSRYTRWQKMRPEKLPHVARPKAPFPAPAD